MCQGTTVNSVRGFGFSSANGNLYVECEAYTCNQSNTANTGGFNVAVGGCTYIRCVSHDNVGTNSSGWVEAGSSVTNAYERCIADTNGQYGWLLRSEIAIRLINCDAYNNVSDGVRIDVAGANIYNAYLCNCNFISNGGLGINNVDTTSRITIVQTCGFFGNTSGQTTGPADMIVNNSITLAASPYADPADGDFSVIAGDAIDDARGVFTMGGSYTKTTTSYHGLGAAQAKTGPFGGGFMSCP